MRRRFGTLSGWLLVAAALAGWLDDRVETRAPWTVGPYRVLAADFHVHAFPFSASTLAPWDLAMEARRRGLDAIAVTGHNQTASGLAGQWFSRIAGGPTVIAGEEIHGPRYHMVAVGIGRTVSWRLTAEQAIDEVHRQGGVAIAAHPLASNWKAFEGPAMHKLDGTEVVQPVAFLRRDYTANLRDFYGRTKAAAIGSSDYHGMGPLGLCRTWVFARDASPAAVLEAIRERRTVVIDRGRAFGDMNLARAAGDRLWEEPPGRGRMGWLSGVCGVAGLAGMAAAGLLAARKA